MAQPSELRVDRVAAMQKRKHWWPAHSNLFQRPANPEIAPCGYQPFFQCLNRFRSSPGLVINFRQVQIKLRVVVLHSQRFAAQAFAVSKAFLGKRSQQACVGKVKRVFGSDSQRAPRVLQSFISMAVAKIFQAFFEIIHSSVCGGGCSYPVGHRLLLCLVGHSQGHGQSLPSATSDRNRTREQF
jgi:hypothetical protein